MATVTCSRDSKYTSNDDNNDGDQIKNGGKHSEHILKSFLNNYISLHNEQE